VSILLNHTSREFHSFFIALFISFTFNLSAQQLPENFAGNVFIVGNLDGNVNAVYQSALKSAINEQQGPVTIIYCGDLLNEKEKIASASDTGFIKSLLDISNSDTNISIIFVPGDFEWDHAGKEGCKHVKNAEKLVNGIAGKQIFLPGDGCPGPEVIDLENDIRLVVINTPWLMHPYDRPYAPDDDCRIMSEEQFFETLEDVIAESKDKHLLVVGHHPAISNGQYAGRMNITHYLYPPVIGSFIAGYHQNIGSVKDLAYPPYRNFSDKMKQMMEDNAPFIYASSHEKNLQVLEYEKCFQVISGAPVRVIKAHEADNTIFRSKKSGFIGVSFFGNGKVVMKTYEYDDKGNVEKDSIVLYQSACVKNENGFFVNTRYAPCMQKKFSVSTQAAMTNDSGQAVAGKEYDGGFLKKIFLGKLYRSSWTTRISVPYLDLQIEKCGLTPTGTGGGRQTHSLSLTGNDGKSYVFRSVDKDPVKALNQRLRKTIVAGIARQFTATQNPYGALPVSYLLDETSILHAKPELYIMPSNPGLGICEKEFGGMLGMLEEKPKKHPDENESSFNADDIVRSFDLFRKLYKDNHNRVDEKNFLEARLFDIWIGDWGRHEDNWKWAGYKSGNKTIYKPVPRDRDHAFSIWNGLLPYFANRQWAMPNVESFEKNFQDIRSLTYPARHLDRLLLTSLQEDEWIKTALRLTNTFSDAVIDSAIMQFPKEVIPVSGITIGKKLKSRREELIEASKEYYKLLARKVNVVGSNKSELFEVKRKEDNTVEVTVRDMQSGKPADSAFYNRIFYPDETKYIHVYGLDGDDIILVSGYSIRSIPVRIFGGKGNDSIVNSSDVKKTKHPTSIYEYASGKNSIVKGNNSRLILSDNRNLVEFNRQPVHYDSYLPLPLVSYTPEDGLAAGLGLIYTFHRFGEEGYYNRLRVTDRFSTQGNVQIRINDEFHHVIGKWNFLLNAEMGQPYPTTYFYGAGNETVKLESIPIESYQSHLYGYTLFGGFQRVFWQKSSFSAGVLYEHNNATLHENSLMEGNDLFGLDHLDYIGPSGSLDIDFRDNALAPKQGTRFLTSSNYLHFNNTDKNYFSSTKVSLEFYQTRSWYFPITLGLKGTYSNTEGDVPFYELSKLGRTSGLRGFSRDRFSGKSAASFNSQLGIEFGTVKTVFAPLTLGAYGFYDLGRVWTPGETSNKIHDGYGGGIYFTPLFEILTTRISISYSEESPRGILEVGFGIGF
jgi:hypothetical protein